MPQPKQPEPDAPQTAPAVPPASDEPRFPRERVLDPTEGPRIAGHPLPVIAGALELAGSHRKHFTRDELAELTGEFLAREVPVEGVAS